ncbi:MAG TPA: NUDIX domain-containing protein [Bacteroidales bacterium]|nr:NUDIX domain-containing protein [Bacteroidales bacterium]
MYKVFFKDRAVFFGDDFSKVFGKNNGLFYKYNNLQELTELVHVFNLLNRIDKLFIIHNDIINVFEEFKACFTYVEAAGGLVLKDTGEFLIMKRDGYWDLPKGKLEQGEGTEEAALREVSEETGLNNLAIVRPVLSTYHTYEVSDDFILKKTKWYEMVFSGNEKPMPQTEENITDIKWVAPGETDFIRKKTYPSVLDVLYIRDLL